MFDNIGDKLKGLALFLCWGGIIYSVISGIIVCSDFKLWIGLLIIVIGSLVSWISSWVIYAIGEIAVNTSTTHIQSTETNGATKPQTLAEKKQQST